MTPTDVTEQLDIQMGENEPQFLLHITHKNSLEMDHMPKCKMLKPKNF